MATQRQIAQHLDIAQQTVSDLVKRDVFPDAGRGQYEVDACRIAYIRHLRGIAAGRAGDGDSDLSLVEERARKAKEEADRLEMENARRRQELVLREDVDSAVLAAFARVRSRLLVLPQKVAPALHDASSLADIENIVRQEIHRALKELSETSISQLITVDASGQPELFLGVQPPLTANQEKEDT